MDRPPKNRRVNPCIQLKNRRDKIKSVHHHHHHHHYYHHFVHHSPCQCSGFEFSDTPPTSAEPAEYSGGVAQDKEDQGNSKEGKKILVVPQIQVFAQAATTLYKDSKLDGPGDMVSTATANINVPGHGSSASVFTYSKTADTVSVAAQATANTIETACSCAAQQREDKKLHVVTKEDDPFESSEEEAGVNENEKNVGCFGKLRNFLKKLVERPSFTRVIMSSIFLNTICMATEHHGQVCDVMAHSV